MTTIPIQPRPVSLRPLALPAEHGGWGFLLEPVVLGLLVAPSPAGAAVAAAAVFGFLVRQPLKLALQDAARRKSYPRTRTCWSLAALYASGGLLTLLAALSSAGVTILIPLAAATPFALVQIAYDGRNRSREPIAEICGAVAMSGIVASIAVAGGVDFRSAFALVAIVLARSLPAILYVRALLHKRPSWLVVLAHAAAIAVAVELSSPLAVVAMAVLLGRAVWGLTHPTPPAKTIGWREVVYGVVTVALIAAGEGW